MFTWMIPLLEAEGAVGAASSAAETPESPSVAAGEESPTAGSAPAADPAPEGTEQQSETAAPDVSQQESFASRLREEREKLELQYKPIQTHYTQMEAISKAAGFESVEQYLQALDDHVRQERAASEAQRMGVDDATYKEYFAPVHDELAKTKQELQELRQSELQRHVRSEYERLKSTYGDFESVQGKVFELAEKRALPLEDAYKLVSFETQLAAAKQEGQAAAVAAIKANADSSTGSVGGDAPDQTFDFTKLSRDERAKYYERAKRGELKSLH